MNISRMTDRDLLAAVIGSRATDSLYRGSLAPLFYNDTDRAVSRLKLLAAKELVTRMLYEELKRDLPLNAPETVKRYLHSRFSGQEHESFLVLFLDAQNRLIDLEEAFRGTLSQTSVYPREIVKLCLRHNAAAVIFAHNHPSEVAGPSEVYEVLGYTLRQAMGFVDTQAENHFVVPGQAAVNWAEISLFAQSKPHT